MIFFALQLFLLLFFFASLIAWSKYKRTLQLITALFTTFEISAVLLSNALIDYKFYIHLSLSNMETMSGFFKKEALILLSILIISFFLLGFLGKLFVKIKNRSKFILPIIFIACIGLMSINEGVIYNLTNVIALQLAKNKDYNESLKNIGFEKFITKSEIKGKKGKNIIFISLESVEEGYLKDNFAHLTPNLRRLSKEMQYYGMTPITGSDFTSGAIYTFLTGFPMLFKNHGNDIFENALDTNIPSISDVFKTAGYNQQFLVGNAEFAGIETMLNLFGMPVKSEKSYDPKLHVKYWGLHDKDLFKIAKQEIKSLHEKEKPFAFFMASISTHYPDGVFDYRVLNEVSQQKSNLETMVAAVDKEIGDLVEFLKTEHIIDNTALYIVPDHLLMGRMSRVLNEFDLPRQQFLITNTKLNSLNSDQNILPIDIPGIILEGAAIENNMTFLTDIIVNDKLDFLNKHKKSILQLNEATLTPKITENNTNLSINNKFQKDKNLIQLESNSFSEENKNNVSTALVGLHEYTIKRGFNLIISNDGEYIHENYDTFGDSLNRSKLVNRLETLITNESHFYVLVHDSVGKPFKKLKSRLVKLGFPKMSLLNGRMAYLAISNHGFTSEEKRKKTIAYKTPIHANQSLRSSNQMKTEATNKDRFIAHAAGSIDGNNYTNCLEAMNLAYEKGFRLIEIDFSKTSDNKFVATHDWNKWRSQTKYKGLIPVPLDTFKHYKILEKYTPISLDDINLWFKTHPDALLVTDKVNDPENFIPLFFNPQQLIMELFSMEAVKTAQKIGIKRIILSEDVIPYFGLDKIGTLKKQKIEYVSASYRVINKNKKFYASLKKAGIKVYAYHLNFDPFHDESYMIREGLDYCYGMYADSWYFK